MIKKLLGGFIITLGIFNIGFADREIFDANESFTVPNVSTFTLRVASSSAGIVDGGGMPSPKPLIVLQSNYNNYTQYRYIYFWGTDNKLYAYGNSNGTPSNPSGLEYLKFDTFYRFSDTNFTNCTYSTLHTCSYSEAVSAESFYSDTALKGSMTRFAYYFNNSNNNYTTFCRIYDNLGFSICVKPSGASTTKLTPVAGLSIDPVEFDTNLIGFSPRIDNVQPEPEPEPTPTDTIEYHPCMTLRELFAMTPELNTGLCYSSDFLLSGDTLTTGNAVDIYTLFPTYQNLIDRVNRYNNYCRPPNTTETCQRAFRGNEKQRSLINKIPNNVDLKDLYNYCDLALNYDRNTTTCVINSGALVPKPGTEPTTEDIINAIKKQAATKVKPGEGQNNGGSGTVYDDIFDESDDARDIIGNMKSIYAKITGLFRNRTGQPGIIPTPITYILLLIILFAIFKK